jgi:hypothetical protein
MDQARSVSVVFTPAPYVRIGATSYATLQDAYNAANTGDVIKLMGNTLTGSLTANRSIDVFIKGGYDAIYAANDSQTALQGSIAVQQGSVRMGRVSLIMP